MPEQPQQAIELVPFESAPSEPELSVHPTERPNNSVARRSLRDLARWHGRRVGWCAVAGAAAGIAYLLVVGPRYTAQARLHVPPPPPRSPISSITGIEPAAVNPNTYVMTQSQLITSDEILNRLSDPEYLRDHLDVDTEDEADIIVLSIKARRERDALDLLGGVTSMFIQHQGFERQSLAGEMIRTLQQRQIELKDESARLMDEMNQYRRDNPNFSVEESLALADNKLKSLSEQLTAIQLETLRAEQSYAPDHPMRQQALALEVQVSNALKTAQDEVLALNEQLAKARELERTVERNQQEIAQVSKRIENLELQRDAESARCGTTVIEPPRIEHASIGAYPLRAIGAFTFGGALFGAMWAYQREGNDRRLRCAEDVRAAIGNDLPVLGVVPLLPKRRTHIGKAMATHLDPRGAAAEAHRTIRSSILLASGTRRSILVTSPNPGDGKSVCATNLAVALAQAGRSVVLVDADLRRPSQHANLDLHEGAGVCEAMESPTALRWAIQPTGIDHFHALTAGHTNRNPGEVLSSAAFRSMLDELAGRYDHVVIDSPPVNLVNDALLIAGCVDAAMLVVRAERTTQDDAARAIHALANAGAQIAGVVVNAAPAGENFGVYAGAYFAPADTALRGAAHHHKPTRRATSPWVPTHLQPV